MSAVDLFNTRSAVLEYRPVRRSDGGVLWYWVLLPLPGEDTALATGSADSKGMASVAGRQFAHRLRRRVTKVRTYGLNQPVTESGLPGEGHQPDQPDSRRALKKAFMPGSHWKRTNWRFPTKSFDHVTLKPTIIAKAGEPVMVTVGRVLVDGVEFILPDGQHSHLAWPDGQNVQAYFSGSGGVELHRASGGILLSYAPA